jgi:hypothetical protein
MAWGFTAAAFMASTAPDSMAVVSTEVGSMAAGFTGAAEATAK